MAGGGGVGRARWAVMLSEVEWALYNDFSGLRRDVPVEG